MTATPTPETDGKNLRPYLVTIQAAGKSSRWQVVATSAAGDKYAEGEGEPTYGEKPNAPEQAHATAGTPAHLEAALVAAILEADKGEIASVDLYSRRPEPPKIGYGATFVFHSGARIYLNAA